MKEPLESRVRVGEGVETVIEGVFGGLVHQNVQDGFTVLSLQLDGSDPNLPKTTKATGVFSVAFLGDRLRMTGKWRRHPKYGLQFSFSRYEFVAPSTVEGVRKYLGSGRFKGLGKHLATQIVDTFGEETLEILDKDPEKLRDIRGIGPKTVAKVIESWKEERGRAEAMAFLQGHGLNASQARIAFEIYGNNAIGEVKKNPYRLCREVPGVGFITADAIASSLGVPKDSPQRLHEGSVFAMREIVSRGSVCYPSNLVVSEARKVLKVETEVVKRALAACIKEGDLVLCEGYFYLPWSFISERGVASRLRRLASGVSSMPDMDLASELAREEEKLKEEYKEAGFERYAPMQREAIRMVLSNKVSVITGGPGVGKTTIINTVLRILLAKGRTVRLAAPTGRAAKKLSESADDHEAMTIHRLLEYNPVEGFMRNEEDPLIGDFFIIDEASMIDVSLMHHLMKALPSSAHLVLVGDVDQLPSVGPGLVLQDIIQSGVVEVTHLDVIFRQRGQRSTIVRWAHQINRGSVPDTDALAKEPVDDLVFIKEDDENRLSDTVVDWCCRVLPETRGYDALSGIQVVAPKKKDVPGVWALNERVKERLNPVRSPDEPEVGPAKFRVGDKVMQIRNNYTLSVYNGDIGKIVDIDEEKSLLVVSFFGGKDVTYTYPVAIDELMHAYVITVHKSQGSEYPAVVIALHTKHGILLKRNLIYTAITRARQLVVLVGSISALRQAVYREDVSSRVTRLKEGLQDFEATYSGAFSRV